MTERFTLVFEGDIRAREFNPLKIETPYGQPIAAGTGDAFAEADRLREALEKVAEARMPGAARRIARLALNTDKGDGA